MQLARVIGTVVCSHKDTNLEGVTLLVVQPLGADREPTGRALVATDAAGAGVGEEVFFVRGREAAYPFYPIDVPTDAAIVGIVDAVSVPGTVKTS
jgi:ethanolamine utilization protein EutN